jgi:hypothetical protein
MLGLEGVDSARKERVERRTSCRVGKGDTLGRGWNNFAVLKHGITGRALEIGKGVVGDWRCDTCDIIALNNAIKYSVDTTIPFL